MRVFVLNINDEAQHQAALLLFAENLHPQLSREVQLRVSRALSTVCHVGLICTNADGRV